ncbi:MAG: hypothetical protein Q9165_000263 [Trypethelium subeluteriae]
MRRVTSRTSRPTARAGAKRSTRASISYREDSTDSSGDDFVSAVSESDAPPPKRQRRAAAPKSIRSGRTVLDHSPRKHNPRNAAKPLLSPGHGKSAPGVVREVPVESDSAIPSWKTLPYEILLEIFTYAFDDLCGHDAGQRKAKIWALDTALICRAFMEPAISALYRMPPLRDLSQPHRLLDCLVADNQDNGIPSLNYGVKVKRLQLEVWETLNYKYHNHGTFDLGKLVCRLPQLSAINIYLRDDFPPYRHAEHSVRWHYPDNLFTALESTQQRLKSFTWNFRLFGDRDALPWINEIHRSKPFQSLRQISILNFKVQGEKHSTIEAVEALAASIAALLELESVCFHSSPGLNGVLLKSLPASLKKLTLENCISIDSESLHAFLESNGSHLKELVLDYNRALDLAFLPHLIRTAPRLEVLKMDMHCYSTRFTHRDSDPLYHTLLASDEIPTWPCTLQTIELIHLRKWESLEAATHFFQSLIDSAKDLPDLRRLILKPILDCSWRDRADFREKWIPRFRTVFLRKCTTPNRHLMSMRAFRRWKKPGTFHEPSMNFETGSKLLYEGGSAERSSNLTQDAGSQQAQTSENDGPSRRTRQSQRIAQTDSQSDQEQSEQGEKSKDDFIQGMCQVVDILIDNQRPMEEQFNEGHFLDSEASGDEDWTGENDVVADDGYACTGQSTWDLPTEAAPGVPTPDPTPSNTTGPYPPPAASGERGMAGEESDRGLGVCHHNVSTLSHLLSNVTDGSQGKPGQQQSGLGGLANQFLGGSHGGQHGGQGGSHSGGGGLVGQIASGLLSGNKPHNQQQQQQGTSGGSSSSHQSGLGGLVGGLLGGHGSHQQQNYGYTNHSSSGPYTGTAPSAAYQPSGSSQYGPTSGTYNPPGQQHQQQQYSGQPTHQAQQGFNQQSQPQYGQQSHSDYPGQSYHQQDQYSSNYSTYGGQQQSGYGQNQQPFPPPPGHDQYNQQHQHDQYQQGGYNQQQYPPPPPMSSHPSSQSQYGSGGQYPPPPSYGQHGHDSNQQGGYGQQQQQGGGYGGQQSSYPPYTPQGY